MPSMASFSMSRPASARGQGSPSGCSRPSGRLCRRWENRGNRWRRPPGSAAPARCLFLRNWRNGDCSQRIRTGPRISARCGARAKTAHGRGSSISSSMACRTTRQAGISRPVTLRPGSPRTSPMARSRRHRHGTPHGQPAMPIRRRSPISGGNSPGAISTIRFWSNSPILRATTGTPNLTASTGRSRERSSVPGRRDGPDIRSSMPACASSGRKAICTIASG